MDFRLAFSPSLFVATEVVTRWLDTFCRSTTLCFTFTVLTWRTLCNCRSGGFRPMANVDVWPKTDAPNPAMTPQLQIGSQWRGVVELSLACIARTVKIQSSIFFATISMMLLCSGCIPYHFTTRSGASGVVLDACTGVPIVGAAESVAPVRGDDPAGTRQTDTDGSFLVPPRSHGGAYLVPSYHFPFPCAH